MARKAVLVAGESPAFFKMLNLLPGCNDKAEQIDKVIYPQKMKCTKVIGRAGLVQEIGCSGHSHTADSCTGYYEHRRFSVIGRKAGGLKSVKF